jgi:transcriptional regulator with GAF, ATPase, and Fis domain
VRGRRGKFECADGGTLFLDEVADLSTAAQAKLLAGASRSGHRARGRQWPPSCKHAGHRGHEQETLLPSARKAVPGRPVLPPVGIEIHVPPLRERREDILELASHFLERHAQDRRLAISRAAGDALLTYDWPGNVRELERMMERTLTLARHSTIDVAESSDSSE